MNYNYTKSGYIPQNTGNVFYAAINEINGIQRDSSIYHYTTTPALDAILKTATFRATNMFYVGDGNAYADGVRHLKRVFDKGDVVIKSYLNEIERLNEMSPGEIYVISFTGNNDTKSQWDSYTYMPGVCIELDKEIIWGQNSNLLYGEKTYTNTDCIISYPCFRKVIYIKDDEHNEEQADKYKTAFAKYIIAQRETIETNTVITGEDIERCWRVYRKEAKAFLTLLASYYTKDYFIEENEIRAVFLPLYRRRFNGAKISHVENRRGVLRPYIEIDFLHSYGQGKPKHEIPIRSIMVGPGISQNEVYHSIIHRLENEEHRTWKYTPKELLKKYQEYLEDFYTYANITDCDVRQDSVLWFLKRISKSIDFDIYYDNTTYDKLYDTLPDANDAGSYTKFSDDDDKLNVRTPETFIRYQENNYMTSDGILITKSRIPVFGNARHVFAHKHV